MYTEIGAQHGDIFWASMTEVEKARTLLKEAILCVCKSVEKTFGAEFYKNTLQITNNKLSLKPTNDVVVP